jgi:hypothetical protein
MWGAYLFYGNDFYLKKKEPNRLIVYLSIFEYFLFF